MCCQSDLDRMCSDGTTYHTQPFNAKTDRASNTKGKPTINTKAYVMGDNINLKHCCPHCQHRPTGPTVVGLNFRFLMQSQVNKLGYVDWYTDTKMRYEDAKRTDKLRSTGRSTDKQTVCPSEVSTSGSGCKVECLPTRSRCEAKAKKLYQKNIGRWVYRQMVRPTNGSSDYHQKMKK